MFKKLFKGEQVDEEKDKGKVAKRHPPISFRSMTSAEALDLVAKEGKFSQESSNFKQVAGSEFSVCGSCIHFQRLDEGEVGLCRVVDGDIPWFSTSDHYISAFDEASFAFDQATKQGLMLRATALGLSLDAMTASDDVQMFEKDLVEKKIVSRDGKFCVTSQDGSRNFGCYPSRAAAQRRLGQIEGFKRTKSADDPDDLVKKQYLIPIVKVDEEKRLVSGVVLEPDVVDAQGDVISAEEIEKTAHNFMLKSRTIGKGHKNKADAAPVESHITSQAIKIGEQAVKKGAWVLTVKLNDDSVWEGVKSGEYTGFSVGGFGRRTPVTPAT